MTAGARSGLAAVAASAALAVLLSAPKGLRGRSAPRGRSGAAATRSAAPLQALDPRVLAGVPAPSAAAAGFDAERVWSGYNDWEPAVAADPLRPYAYQLTTRYNGPRPCEGCRGPWIVFRRSTDGGATWEPDRFLTPLERAHNDPQIEVAGPQGTVYAAWLHGYEPGVRFVRSTDHGLTWSAPSTLAPGPGPPGWSDKPLLAASADGRHVYVAFNAGDSYVAASHDAGVSFSAPVPTGADGRYWFHTGGAVAPDGTVYFAATTFADDYRGDAHVEVLRSVDEGETWTVTRVDTSREAPDCAWSPGCYFGFLGPSAALAADSGGRIVVAYNAGDARGAPQRMFTRASRDGIAWTSRLEVGDTSGVSHHAFPGLAAGPAPGDFRLVWQDDRAASREGWHTWYRRTTDGGASWSDPARTSDATSGAAYKSPTGYAFPYGDYLELAVDGLGTAHVVWGAGASYDGPGGTWFTRGR